MQFDTQSWKSKQIEHEGLPLFLRYRENDNSDRNQKLYPVLAVITHELSKVSPNGLPDPDYNDDLIDFDRDIRAAFEQKQIGYAVLIETFAGKRKYYIYVAQEINIVGNLKTLMAGYPNEHVTWALHPDHEWNFIKKYSMEFLE